MRNVPFLNGWFWAAFFTTLVLSAALLEYIFLPNSSLSRVTTEAFRLGGIGVPGFLGFLFWIHFGKFSRLTKQQWLSKGLVAFLAYIVLFISFANVKIHFFQNTGLLPLSLFLIGILGFLLAAYFGRARPLLRVGGTMVFLTAVLSGFGNWLPQVEGGFPRPTIPLDVYSMTPQQLADEGEKIIFGGIGQSMVQGAIGRGQCPLCHGFRQGYASERAPNLWGITVRKRLHETSIEYIAESHTCPSCYVVGGFGLKGTENRESPMPRIHKPPISLTIEDLIAVDTWLFFREGETPPTPEQIKAAYLKVFPESEFPKNENPFIPQGDQYSDTNDFSKVLATGKERLEGIFLQSGCMACHEIPGITGAKSTFGPKLTMGTSAPLRLSDPHYSGNATTVREYIKESILNPKIYVTKGFRDNLMPRDYGTAISALALDKMVDYLATQGESKKLSH